jgi:hypothetical protein
MSMSDRKIKNRTRSLSLFRVETTNRREQVARGYFALQTWTPNEYLRARFSSRREKRKKTGYKEIHPNGQKMFFVPDLFILARQVK